MELIKWNAKYCVGVEEIDTQHQRLFALINQLVANFGGNNRQEMANALEEMVNYIDYHFNCEEKYFKSHPRYEDHRREHYEFVRKTLELQKDFLQKRADITRDVLQFLISWLKNHILGTDRKFFTEMQQISP